MSKTDAEKLRAEVVEFLQKDYELKVRYLVDHYGRIWTRFNFFMVAETALAGLLGQALSRGESLSDALPFPIAGAFLALCWYAFGAQDRYLVEAYRVEIARVANQLVVALGLAEELKKLRHREESFNLPHGYELSEYVRVGDVTRATVPPKLYQWRSERFSITKLVAWFPLVVLFSWLVLIVAGTILLGTGGDAA